jgi:hypothetical protein
MHSALLVHQGVWQLSAINDYFRRGLVSFHQLLI